MTRDHAAASAVVRVGTGVATALVAAFAVSVAVREPGTVVHWADAWATVGLYFVAAVTIAVAGRSSNGAYAIAAALAIYGTGDLVWSLTDGEAPLVLGLPGYEWFWLGYYPFAFIGIRRLSPAEERSWVGTLDAIVVGAAAFVTVALLTSLTFDLIPGSTTVVILNALYVIGDLIILAMVFVLLLRHRFRVSDAWWLLVAGLVVNALADITYWAEAMADVYTEGSWLDLLWLVGALLITFASVKRSGEGELPQAMRTLGAWAPTLALVVAGLALAWGAVGPFSLVIRAAATVAIAAAVVRLNLAIREARDAADLRQRVYTDELTGLRNRPYLLTLNSAAALAPSPAGWSLLVVGLDRFRDVNATLGHDGGDRVLVEVSERLRASLRGTDVLVRLDGDEFAVLLANAEQQAVLDTAERLLAQLQAPIVIDGIAVTVTACVGACSQRSEIPDPTGLLRNADEAMNTAKADGPGMVRTFSGRASAGSAARLQMRSDLRYALTQEPGQFRLRYQPIVRASTGRVFASEALIRWFHDGDWRSPAEFLDEVQFAGLMPQLTRVVLHRALTDVTILGPGNAVTVNVPPDLVTDWLTRTVIEMLEETAAAPKSLIIEVTEDALLRNPEDANAVIGDLRAMGVRVFLDDFGSGWCGLSAVRDLAIDGLKIDRSFVSRLGLDAPTRAITSAIADMSRSLGLTVIGEGAEDDDEVRALQALGIDLVQGFALHRPMMFSALQETISEAERA